MDPKDKDQARAEVEGVNKRPEGLKQRDFASAFANPMESDESEEEEESEEWEEEEDEEDEEPVVKKRKRRSSGLNYNIGAFEEDIQCTFFVPFLAQI